jgi:transaldolase / glucose-6-phosphate isomerase
MIATLGRYQAAVDAALAALERDDVMGRIWAHDHTVWKDDPTEITNRLGWLTIADAMQDEVARLNALVAAVQADGYTHALLLGMGGSSLAPEVFRVTFGVAAGHLDLAVLDSTDPGTVLAYAEQLDLSKTLFFVSTKSGGTVETLSFFKTFYNRVVDAVGADAAGAHFVAITDPGSKLVTLAEQYGFRATLINDPNIGGRYSALSFFGLAPAAVLGVDVPKLLSRAQAAAANANGPQLGVIMGELALAGRDKLTLITSPAISSFGDWVEQLVAESTGKEGKGILPVVGEPMGSPDVYGNDRLFVYLKLAGDSTYDAVVQALEDAGQPVVRIDLNDLYDLGAGFFLWEIATAVASYRLAINPFDQPNVESAKVLARQMVAAYHESGELPTLTPTLESGDLTVYGDVQADSPGAALKAFVAQGKPGAYIALQAYIQPGAEAEAALQKLRVALRAATGYAVTVGYGPRFLHSTGQLHKGDSGNGLFIQFTAATPRDADIPDEAGKPESAMSFGVLKESQALGDRQALLDAGRHVIRFDLGADVPGVLAVLAAALA